MDVPQGQVRKAAGGDLLPADGIVPDLRRVDLPVEQTDMDFAVRRGGKAGQEALRLFRPGKGPAVDHQVFLRPRHGRQAWLGENMHVFRPLHRQVGAAGAVPVMVAGGNIDLGVHLTQGGGKTLRRVPVSRRAVEQVSCQQHQLHAVLIGVVGKAHRQFPALPAAVRRLLRRQSGKGTVQVEVRRVNEFQHSPLPQFSFSSGRQPLVTSTQATKLEEYFSSSSQVISMALLLLPAAGNTVSNRFRETSR